jgi:hypothetical protein
MVVAAIVESSDDGFLLFLAAGRRQIVTARDQPLSRVNQNSEQRSSFARSPSLPPLTSGSEASSP